MTSGHESDAERLARVVQAARDAFGAAGCAVRAPGRVNLIGDHTDYQNGLALPMALDLDTWAVANTRPDRRLRLVSLTLGQQAECDLEDPQPKALPAWARYPLGVALALERQGVRLPGADLLFDSTVPIGAGLSSSAALEVATALALERMAGAVLTPMKIVRVCHEAETRTVGVPCGILDQYTSVCAEPGAALVLDCRDVRHTTVPMPENATIVIADSGVRRVLGDSGYQQRREETNRAVALLQQAGYDVRSLRDITSGLLPEISARLPEPERQRVRHVVGENARVQAMARAFDRADLATAGALMTESHRSLRDDFEVSTPEVDALVDAALAAGALGSRITGGGFGGATVSLLSGDAAEFVVRTGDAYRARTGREARCWVCRPAGGAGDVVIRSAGEGFVREEHRLADGRPFINYRFPPRGG